MAAAAARPAPVATLEVEAWPVDRPQPYERNARKITAQAIAKVAKSIAAFGWRQPVVVDEQGVILVGHTRVLAAKSLGLTHVPVHVARGLTPEEARTYRLMDNRSNEETRWDRGLLKIELGALKVLGADLGLTGFNPQELERYVPGEAAGADDDAPAKPTKPVTRPGDLWIMGRHRLLCGDATNAEDVAKLLAGEKPHLMVTDPPYGVVYDAGWRNDGTIPRQANGVSREGAISNDDRADWRDAWALFPGDVAYVWHASLRAGAVQESLHAMGFESRAMIIMAKHHATISRGHYHWQHEPCWYAVRKGGTGHWSGDRSQTTLWAMNVEQGFLKKGGADAAVGHVTQKPIEAMQRPMLNNSKPGDVVYDPFMGSGTTIMAAETSERACYGLDVDPGYVDVAVMRWQGLTGKTATREADGVTFDACGKETNSGAPAHSHGQPGEAEPGQAGRARRRASSGR